MTDSEQLSALHTAVNCYISTLLAVADCLGGACPAVGGPYRHRISRLRSRLAFDTTSEAMVDSAATVESLLKEYAMTTAGYIAQHGMEVRRAVDALEGIVRLLSQRQDFYDARLRQFAAQVESTRYPDNPDHLAEVIALQVAGLLGCVESMSNDTQSLLAQMRTEMSAVTGRLAEAAITDPVTGLMNRREMERQIELRRMAGEPLTLLMFELIGGAQNELAQQVAARLGSQFRHYDLICRWSDHEFLVLFQGSPATAQARAEQIVPWVTGRYLLDSGETVEIRVEARLTEPELVA